MNFITEKLKKISETVGWHNVHGYLWKAWWGGATDVEKEGTWTWATGKYVDTFVWGPGQPDNTFNQDYFCFLIDQKTYQENFVGHACTAYNYPLCQRKLHEPVNKHLGCNENWEDASNMGLGYLWFETTLKMNYGNAITFCKDKNSSLVEIDSPEQMNYTIMRLKVISENVDWEDYNIWYEGEYYTYEWKGWWGGATEKEDNSWLWTESGASLEFDSFVWGRDQPNDPNGLNYFCFVINPAVDNFYGNDKRYGSKNYPLCQQKM